MDSWTFFCSTVCSKNAVLKSKEVQLVRTASLNLGVVFNKLAFGETKIFKILNQLNKLQYFAK